MDKILQLVEEEFEGIEVIARFTERLLEDIMQVLKNRAMDAPIRGLNHNMKTKD